MRIRDRRPNTVHHLVSRIAHRVYFLKEEERNDFVDLMLRVADFSGIQLIGWCVMTNHFHILAYLPETPDSISDDEVVRRWQRIEPVQGRYGVECDFPLWSKSGNAGVQMKTEALDRLRKRMYDIGWFMKMVKQWFSESYNCSTMHSGTMWEAVYHDRVIEDLGSESIDCLCYIHLNPIKAALTDSFDGYPWSSLCALKKGDGTALDGMRMLYGHEISEDDMLKAHRCRMGELLDGMRLRKAREIAMKRAAGIEIVADNLTDEAMVAQQGAQLQELEREIADVHARRQLEKKASERRAQLEKEIELLIKTCPDIRTEDVASIVAKPLSTVYRIIKKLRTLGRLAA